MLIGELGLDGRIRPIQGILPAVLAAANRGCRTVVVPQANAAEAELVPDMQVVSASTLRGLLCLLRDEPPPIEEGEEDDFALPADGYAIRQQEIPPDLDLADVRGRPRPAARWRSARREGTTSSSPGRPAAGRRCSRSGCRR